MIQYVIVGTSHEVQDTALADDPVRNAASKHSVSLIAEEFPFDIPSRVSILAKGMSIPYLQIDAFPRDWTSLGIDREMRARNDLQTRQDIRLSNADGMREEFWLKRIEAEMNQGCALVICGYLHIHFLAQMIYSRGSRVLAMTTFPIELLRRKPDLIFNPAEFEAYVRERQSIGLSLES